ncbi:MAG TPA: winged helix-turn-helix domain-containing protein [Terracidiphilus sp.]
MGVAVYEIGAFRLDCGRFELLRNERSVKLERKPLELLILLVECRDRLVTREEVARRLWHSGVFVDTDHGINTAVRKLRQALRDDPEDPQFIQTVTGMGYRFVAPVVLLSPGPVSGAAESPALPTRPVPEPQTQQPFRRKLWIGLSVASTAILLAVATFGSRSVVTRFFHRATPPAISSIAVLPLDNLSGDPNQEYFADGMTDELITMLAKDSNLRITSRTSVMQYKGAKQPLPQIARALHVDAIIEGSVSRSNDRVHLTLQLVNAETDAHLWAESYDRSSNLAVDLPNEASETIAKYLHSYVHSAPSTRPVNPEAHDAYLRGHYLWWGGQKDLGLADFKRATEIQPDYAMGWAGLAEYYGGGVISGNIDPKDGLGPALADASKAVQLDDSQPGAHLMLCGSIMAVQWDFAHADKECLRAIELDPKFAEAYHLRAKLLGAFNRHDEAIEDQRKAAELDPLARPWGLANAYLVARRFDDAIREARQRLDSFPNDASIYDVLSSAYQGKGMDKEAEEAKEMQVKVGGYPQFAAFLHRLYQRRGAKGVLQWSIRQIEEDSKVEYIPPDRKAELYARAGDHEKALSLLEEGFRQHSPRLLWIQSDPAFDSLHSDPRYRSLIQQIGLPPAY